MTWVVTLTYDADPSVDNMDWWAEELDHLDGSVARGPSIPYGDIDSTSVTVYISGEAAAEQAIAYARKHVDQIPILNDARLLSVDVTDEELYLRRADAPTLPEMVSSQEVAEILGVTRQRVSQLRSSPAFPAALLELRTGPIWNAAAIKKFARDWPRKPGRPKMTANEAVHGLRAATRAIDSAKALDRVRARNRSGGVTGRP